MGTTSLEMEVKANLLKRYSALVENKKKKRSLFAQHLFNAHHVYVQAMEAAGEEPFPTIYVDSKEEGEVRSRLMMEKGWL